MTNVEKYKFLVKEQFSSVEYNEALYAELEDLWYSLTQKEQEAVEVFVEELKKLRASP